MTHTAALLIVAGPALAAVVIGSVLLRRAFVRTAVLPEEVMLAVAWVFAVGSLVWLEVYLSGSTLLGFSAPWTWLAAAHFAAAGFGALTVTALCCRAVSNGPALRVLRALLFVHPVAYLVVAAGISDVPYCDEIGASLYAGLFAAQLGAAVLGGADRLAAGPRWLLLLALAVPLWTIVPALAWAWGVPLFDLGGMVRYHGLVNAVGHVGLGLVAFWWGRPPAHANLASSSAPSTKLKPPCRSIASTSPCRPSVSPHVRFSVHRRQQTRWGCGRPSV